ncbi:hypothetical protein [Nocardioides cavernaquae]|uniref:Uncharacterized protein n=1 Tax=Nocardioides cavernaquae TaxID=2321396 RepID=A0A3A5H667_9ACTN|nr:hypothetical protein [Nocardioides cavernaquae]RJS45358.1 hypothetical protein D4739_03415 [Nocardioides cavernaquae]
MHTLTAPSRIRMAVGAVTLVLATGCAGEAPSNSELDRVPSTLAARPTPRAQPKITLEIDTPARFLNGYAESSGDEVWQKSMDLLRDWTFNPELVQPHTIKKGELDGLLPLLTGEAEQRWRKAIRRALPLWMSPSPKMKKMARAQLEILQLVIWNIRPPTTRGWGNPMFTPVRITHGRIQGGGDLGVMFQVHTALRWRGHGLEYEVPYDSFIQMNWRRVDGEWKIAAINRAWTLKEERLVGPPEAVKSSRAAAKASRSAEPAPSERPSTRPSVIDSAP